MNSMEKRPWRDLPIELLSSIMTNLEIKENVRASAVCKSWHKAAVSVRIIEQPPWLMYFYETRNTYELYNPSNSKKHTMELPKSLSGYKVRYTKDEWLLMSENVSSDFVLFNPFTTDLVVLPYLNLWYGYQLVGFSSPPTSSDCVVLAIKDYDPGHMTIRTWSPGQSTWTSIQVDSQFLDVNYNYVVFLKGMFYCLNFKNDIAVFDPSLRTWNVLDVAPPKCPDHVVEGHFMVGYKGDIFIVCTFVNKKPFVFRLDLTQGVWQKKENLGSLTVFASSTGSCQARTYVNDGMLRNSICFVNKTLCLTYSFDERSYHPSVHDLDWRSSERIWIDPPKNGFDLV